MPASGSAAKSEPKGLQAAARVPQLGLAPANNAGVFWHGFKFVKLFSRGQQHGWEATCYFPGHKHQKYPCRKTMTFAKNGGQAMVERKLQYWCLSAPHFDDRDGHVFCGEYLDHLVPSADELEELAAGAEAERAQPPKPKVANTSSASSSRPSKK